MSYYQAAVKLADAMIDRFYDRSGGAFFDAAAPAGNAPPLGALAARRKPLQDSPTPAGNPTAASALLRLEALSGRKEYREIAEETLASFAGIVEHFGLYAGSYGLALERLLLDPVQVVVIGSGAEAKHFEAHRPRILRRAEDRDPHRSRAAGSGRHSRCTGGNSSPGKPQSRRDTPAAGAGPALKSASREPIHKSVLYQGAHVLPACPSPASQKQNQRGLQPLQCFPGAPRSAEGVNLLFHSLVGK
jgi:hypothetical protein